eukprot:gb/GEZN01006461.1/.p1 GENE.gb/GEZN01006461.1/~~gb/GEZN01006461.1/.p1  ORF type:complete len:392 (+),score=44.49 gb/GEZN01006461.1/:49-1224(+)
MVMANNQIPGNKGRLERGSATLSPRKLRQHAKVATYHSLAEQESVVKSDGLGLKAFEFTLVVYYYLAYLPGYLFSSSFMRVCTLLQHQVHFVILFICTLPRYMMQQLFVRFYGYWMSRTYIHKDDVALEFGPSVSFGGGGMLWTYYLGVAHYIFKHYDTKKIKFLASSGGCFSAVPLAMGLDPYEWCKADWNTCLDHYSSRTMGQYMDSCEFYRKLWDRYLPHNAHELASGRLFLSITLFPSFQGKVVSQFENREDLISCIIASTCLPLVFLRDFPYTKFGLAIDGGLSNDQPAIDRYTITVSVLNASADLVPSIPCSILDVVKTPQSVKEALFLAGRGYRDAGATDLWNRAEWTANLLEKKEKATTPLASPLPTPDSSTPPSPSRLPLSP